MAMARPIAGSPLTRNIEVRRVGVAAAHRGDVAQPQQPAVSHEVLLEDVLLGLEGAGHPQREFLVAGTHHARRAHHVLGLQAGEDGRLVEPEPGQPLGIENSMKICSSCAPSRSILVTSGSSSNRERASST